LEHLTATIVKVALAFAVSWPQSMVAPPLFVLYALQAVVREFEAVAVEVVAVAAEVAAVAVPPGLLQ
jgi:hypothetical protein